MKERVEVVAYFIKQYRHAIYNPKLPRIVSNYNLTNGVFRLTTRLLGTLPSPLIFGSIIDYYCNVWSDETNGKCWNYDLEGWVDLRQGQRAHCH